MAPACQTEVVRTFLGFTGCYRRFCPDYAKVAKPLNKLTATRNIFTWGEQEQKSYDQLKKFIINALVLAYLRPIAKFILDTDARLDGIGQVLSQIQGNEE